MDLNASVKMIYISLVAGEPMQRVSEVEAIAGVGLKGDRYAVGNGSFNKGDVGKRQVTLMNDIFFEGSGFEDKESRRNIIIHGVELMWLIGREFKIGDATMRGVKYCDPCLRPSKLAKKKHSFQEAFFDRGGLVAEVLESGIITIGSLIIPPPKGY